MSDAVEPKDMDWIENGVLGIEWSDGHKGVYPIRYLRQHCPCAACTDEWTGELRIKPDSLPMLIAVKDIEPVGRYGLRFRWSDGHDTGIYSFSILRDKFCRCGAGKAALVKKLKAERDILKTKLVALSDLLAVFRAL